MTPVNVTLSASVAEPGKAYTIKNYYDDLYAELFASCAGGKKLSAEEKTLQREILTASAKEVSSFIAKSFAEPSAEVSDTCHHQEDEMWCGCCGLGEMSRPYQAAVSIATIDEINSYRIVFLGKVKSLASSLRHSAHPDDRAHYEYLYAKAKASFEK